MQKIITVVDDFDSVPQDFRTDFESQYRVIEVDQALIQSASQQVIQYPLLAYYAMQLASALRVKSIFSQMPDIQLVFFLLIIVCSTLLSLKG